MDCKYKYKPLSSIKIKCAVCVSTAVFDPAEGCALYRPAEQMSQPSLPRLYQSVFHPVFQRRQRLCSVRSPWTAPAHVT